MRTSRTGGAFDRYLRDTLEMLRNNTRPGAAMMTVALHPRVIGRPGYARGLDAFPEHAAALGDVWFARRDEIACDREIATRASA
ncbi:MAG TPA: hypothetical protein VNS09_15260 [Solirubrobacter sp.]|nr:hypothetical protein [Solirubrobacter sp.]